MLFTDNHNKWRIMTVPVTQGSFQNRKPLPEPWRGLRDAEVNESAEAAPEIWMADFLPTFCYPQLSAKTGVPGGVFVHAAGFTGGNETRVRDLTHHVACGHFFQISTASSLSSIDRRARCKWRAWRWLHKNGVHRALPLLA